MNLSLPARRNSFTPALLLLPLPALLVWLHSVGSVEGRMGPGRILILLVTLCLVAPWVWWRSGGAPPALRRVFKEVRAVLPGLLLAILGPQLVGLALEPADWGAAALPYFLGILLMGAGVFGSEFEHRTLFTCLGQPRSRGQIFREKLVILGVLVSSSLLLLGLGAWDVQVLALPTHFDWDAAVPVLVVTGVVFTTAPAYTLLSRSSLAGAVFTIAGGGGFWALSLGLVGATRWGFERLFPQYPMTSETWMSGGMATALVLYAMAGLITSWRLFSRLEDRASAGQEAVGSPRLGLGWGRSTRSAGWTAILGTGATAHLIRKELRLHFLPRMLAASLVAGALLVWLVRPALPPGPLRELLQESTGMTGILGLAACLTLMITGASSTAEERQLGTLAWQQTQPVPLPRQWRIKLVTTLVVAGVTAYLVPLTLLWLLTGSRFVVQTLMQENGGQFLSVLGGGLLLMVVSVYTSSFSRSSLKAVVPAVALTGVLLGIVGGSGGLHALWEHKLLFELQTQVVLPSASAPSTSPAFARTLAVLGQVGIPAVASLAFLALVLTLAGSNFLRGDLLPSSLRRQIFALLSAALLLGPVTAWLAVAATRPMQWIEVHAHARTVRTELRATLESKAQAGVLPLPFRQRLGFPTATNVADMEIALWQRHGLHALWAAQAELAEPDPRPTIRLKWDSRRIQQYNRKPGTMSPPDPTEPADPALQPEKDPAPGEKPRQ
jgi:hypothetical protein